MAFNFQAVIKRAIAQPFFDTSPGEWADELQIKVTPAVVADGQPFWRAICGYNMSNKEGGSNPAIYLAAIDEEGVVVRPQSSKIKMSVFGWTWEGRRSDEPARPVNGDKGANEPPANITLGKNQIATIWVIDDIPSDQVYNLRTDWPQAVYHTSTFVCWQRSIKGGGTPIPPVPPDCAELQKQVDDLRFRLKTIEGIAKGV